MNDDSTPSNLSDMVSTIRRVTYEVIRPRMPDVDQALENGWSLNEVVEGLRKEGYPITVASLKYHRTTWNREKAEGTSFGQGDVEPEQLTGGDRAE